MVDPGHPPAWVVDLYSADPTLVEPDAAAHLDTCAECRRAVGLPVAVASPRATESPRLLRPAWGRPRTVLLTTLALAAAVLVGVRLTAGPALPTSGPAAAQGAKGPAGAGEVTLALRSGESLSAWTPETGAAPSPGDTLVFLTENTSGHAVIAYFEATGHAGAQMAPRIASADSPTNSLGFKLDAYVGRQRVTLALYDAAPDAGALDASLRARWQQLTVDERARLSPITLEGARESFSWVIETSPP
jgi:hypothetical protein